MTLKRGQQDKGDTSIKVVDSTRARVYYGINWHYKILLLIHILLLCFGLLTIHRVERLEIMDEIIAENQIDIKSLILTVRGMQVLLDSDVAMLYGYETKQINRTAGRNIGRFPESFRFQLTKEEIEAVSVLRCQDGTLKRGQHRNTFHMHILSKALQCSPGY